MIQTFKTTGQLPTVEAANKYGPNTFLLILGMFLALEISISHHPNKTPSNFTRTFASSTLLEPTSPSPPPNTGQVHPLAGTPPGQVHTPFRQVHTPRQVLPPGHVHPPWAGTPHLPGRHTPLTTVTAADGTHPTGMLSCFICCFIYPSSCQL